MAEFVEKNIQEMIPELEELRALELLSSEEVKKLVETKRTFEYKISRVLKSIDDFTAYVLFEIKLLELIGLRRKKVSNYSSYEYIESSMKLRTLRRLKVMTRKWRNDLSLWQLRNSFCVSQKLHNEASSTYEEQMRFHAEKLDLWISWAKFEIEYKLDFNRARKILLSEAALHHKNSFELTKEHFRLELLFIEHMMNKITTEDTEDLDDVISDNREKVLKCEVPEMIFDNAVQSFGTPELFFEFYSIANIFPFAHHLRNQIFRVCLENYKNDPITWKLKAVRVLSGLSDQLESTEVVIKLSPEEKLQSVFRIYDEALEHLKGSFLPTYFDQLFDFLYQCWKSDLFDVVSQKLFSLFKSFSKELSSQQFLIWYHLASHLKLPLKELKQIIFEAKASYPDCPYIKLVWLKCRLLINPGLKLNKDKFIKGLSGDIGAQIVMTYLKGSSHVTRTYLNKLIQKAVNHTDPHFSKTIRLEHLKLLNEKGDMKSVRKHYNNYRTLPPFNTDVQVNYILFELQSGKKVAKRIRKAFEDGALQFGKSHVGLWLSYIEFERKYGSTARISQLNQTAQDNLDAESYKKFIELKFIIANLKDKKSTSNRVFLETDNYSIADEKLNPKFWKQNTLQSIFETKPVLKHLAIKKRRNLFEKLARISKEGDLPMKSSDFDNEKAWERLLSFIVGQKVSLSIKEAANEDFGIEKDSREFFAKTNQIIDKKFKNLKLSNRIESKAPQTKIVSLDKDINEILEKSATLKADFLQQKQIVPYYLSKNVKARMRKEENSKTSGKGWFNMKAPEITPKVKKDLDLLQMRSLLNPKQSFKFKNSDIKEAPKFFQMGKVVDSPIDFYSSRVPKKERKQTFAEEIMNDPEIVSYQKRKHSELIQRDDAKRRKISKVKKSDMKAKRKSIKNKPNGKGRSKAIKF